MCVVLGEGEANGGGVPCQSLAEENGKREPKGDLKESESEEERESVKASGDWVTWPNLI